MLLWKEGVVNHRNLFELSWELQVVLTRNILLFRRRDVRECYHSHMLDEEPRVHFFPPQAGGKKGDVVDLLHTIGSEWRAWLPSTTSSEDISVAEAIRLGELRTAATGRPGTANFLVRPDKDANYHLWSKLGTLSDKHKTRNFYSLFKGLKSRHIPKDLEGSPVLVVKAPQANEKEGVVMSLFALRGASEKTRFLNLRCSSQDAARSLKGVAVATPHSWFQIGAGREISVPNSTTSLSANATHATTGHFPHFPKRLPWTHHRKHETFSLPHWLHKNIHKPSIIPRQQKALWKLLLMRAGLRKDGSIVRTKKEFLWRQRLRCDERGGRGKKAWACRRTLKRLYAPLVDIAYMEEKTGLVTNWAARSLQILCGLRKSGPNKCFGLGRVSSRGVLGILLKAKRFLFHTKKSKLLKQKLRRVKRKNRGEKTARPNNSSLLEAPPPNKKRAAML